MPKFLIIRFSSIGDIVLTTPVVRCLKQQVKDAEIHFLTKPAFADVLSGNPYIDKLLILDGSIASLASQLKKENYSSVIDLHHNQRSWLLKRQLKSSAFSFHKLNIEKWLMVNFKINRLPARHIVDRYMDTVKSLGVNYDGAGLDFFISPDTPMTTELLPPPFLPEYSVFVIGAKHATKRLPEDKIISICKKLNSPLVLLGGPEDKEKGEFVASKSGNHVYSACGKTSLHQSARLIQTAQKVISHDTGLMHIAAAFQKDIVSIWGNTIPVFGMFPFYSDKEGGTMKGLNTVIEVKNLSCRPCSKIGFEKCPKGHLNCLREIDESEIIRRVRE